MDIKKFIHSNKGFFLLSVAAAVIGTIVSIFFTGCTKVDEEQNKVIASKRVTIDVQEISPEEVLVTSIKEKKSHDATPGLEKKEAREKKHKSPARKVKKAPQKKTAEAVVIKKKAEQKKTTLDTRTKSWAINVASFTRMPEAKKLKKRLISSGRSAYITEFTKGGILYYRVRVGFFASRSEAKREGRAVSSHFKNTGDAWVVQPGKTEIASHSK